MFIPKGTRTMKKILQYALLAACLFVSQAFAVGLMPVPVLKDVQVRAQTRLDASTGHYTYAYSVNNPAQNTGEILRFYIDIMGTEINWQDTSGLTIPIRNVRYDYADYIQKREFEYTKNRFGIDARRFVPFGQNVPPGWNGGLTEGGHASFSSPNNVPNIKPGNSLSGFELISRGVPSIRKIQLIPNWVLVLESEDDYTPEIGAASDKIKDNMVFETITLGPSGFAPGTFAHWSQFRDDLTLIIQLGWVPDNTLANKLTTQLAAARQAADAQNVTLATTGLKQLINTISASTSTQRIQEVYDLVRLNAENLLVNLRVGIDYKYEPKLSITHQSSGFNLGATQTITATLFNVAENNAPIPDSSLLFTVESGPHAPLYEEKTTNSQGQATFTYTGQKVGQDVFTVYVDYRSEGPIHESGLVLWKSGPDLVVPVFTPPVLQTSGGRVFYLNEITMNMGEIASPPSVTRYFLYPNANLNPSEARVIGERAIPALQPEEPSDSGKLTFIMPTGLPDGMYYLAACADSNLSVAELDETNNCSFNKLDRVSNIITVMNPPQNQPPVCDSAVPSVASLWPPNHKLADITIKGVTTQTGNQVSIRITGITQDEPVNGLGDGDTSPDGFGIGKAMAQVRAERSGTGNGRVYSIAFTAEDDTGGTCSASINVGVPHDQGQEIRSIDDGQFFNSTQW